MHHTQFRTNYSLFMPLYDYIYGTTDKSSDALYVSSLKRGEELPDVVHLTHLTTPESIYHLQLGFADLASKPYASKWYLWLMWPVTLWSMTLNWIYGRTFVVERHRFDKLSLQTWALPKYKIQVSIFSHIHFFFFPLKYRRIIYHTVHICIYVWACGYCSTCCNGKMHLSTA